VGGAHKSSRWGLWTVADQQERSSACIKPTWTASAPADRLANQHGRPPQSLHKRSPPRSSHARRAVRRQAERSHSLGGRHVTSRPPSVSASSGRSCWMQGTHTPRGHLPTTRGGHRGNGVAPSLTIETRSRRPRPQRRERLLCLLSRSPPRRGRLGAGDGRTCWQPPNISRSRESEAREGTALPLSPSCAAARRNMGCWNKTAARDGRNTWRIVPAVDRRCSIEFGGRDSPVISFHAFWRRNQVFELGIDKLAPGLFPRIINPPKGPLPALHEDGQSDGTTSRLRLPPRVSRGNWRPIFRCVRDHRNHDAAEGRVSSLCPSTANVLCGLPAIDTSLRRHAIRNTHPANPLLPVVREIEPQNFLIRPVRCADFAWAIP
jgi:hypothetical protein